MDRSYDRIQLRNLIHYVIWVAGARPNFGATKLYKVAWFSDARHFLMTGQSITGAKYIRERHGPLPIEGMSIRSELAAEGFISQIQINQGTFKPWKFRALRNPDLHWFNRNQKEILDFWINEISENHSAESISDESHDYPWDIARMKEPLPFTSFLANRIRDPENGELEEFKARAKELGLS